MLVELPIFYNSDSGVVEPRRWGDNAEIWAIMRHGHVFLESLSFDVLEVASDEAPVCLTASILQDGRMHPVEVRHFADGFYMNGSGGLSKRLTRVVPDVALIRGPTDSDWEHPLQDALLDAYTLSQCRASMRAWFSKPRVKITPFHNANSTDRARKMAAVTRLGNDLLSIDGQMWSRIAEPRLLLSPLTEYSGHDRVRLGSKISLVVEEPTYRNMVEGEIIGAPDSHLVFNIRDFYSGAFKHACEEALEGGNPLVVKSYVADLDVLMPDLFQYDRGLDIVDRAYEFVEFACFRFQAQWTPEYRAEVERLKTARADFLESRDHEAFASAMLAFPFDDDTTEGVLRKALEQWESRTITLPGL
jgi:hypothetical protein